MHKPRAISDTIGILVKTCFRFMKYLLIIIALITSSGCSTMQKLANDDRRLTITPTWHRITEAANRAISDPGTIIPAAAAIAVAMTGKDREWALDAYKNHYLFGNDDDAHLQSERGREFLYLLMASTAFAAEPVTDENRYTEGALLATTEFATISATTLATRILKKNISRKIPNYDPTKPDDESFPSNHATEPFAAAAVIRRNLDRADISEGWKNTINGISYFTASAASWARIEMGLHYPTDQLLSAAVGNFVGLFVHDAFILNPKLSLTLVPDRERFYAGIGYRF